MRSTRRWNPRNVTTCAITLSVSTTNKPPRMGNSKSVCVSRASPAMPPPSASEPVSPMKTRAGAAFHHKNPAHAHAIPAATMLRLGEECSPAGPCYLAARDPALVHKPCRGICARTDVPRQHRLEGGGDVLDIPGHAVTG